MTAPKVPPVGMGKRSPHPKRWPDTLPTSPSLRTLDAPGPIVEVIWIDSVGSSHWHEPEEAEALLGKFECRSAGYLIHDKPEGIVIALGAGGLGQRLGSMAIPRGSVISVRHLDKKAKP